MDLDTYADTDLDSTFVLKNPHTSLTQFTVGHVKVKQMHIKLCRYRIDNKFDQNFSFNSVLVHK